jgi:hypothetical protein
MTENMIEGYQDGLAGRVNADHSPEYCTGWEIGWRKGMMTWNNTFRPRETDDTEVAA